MIKALVGYQDHISLSRDQLLTNGEVIAIVDDDQTIRDPLRMYLEEEGLAAETANSGDELFRLLASRDVALILLDIGLPDADGITLIPQIVEKYPDIAIIMLTGVADLQTALDCIRKGADDYLSKPAKFHEILFVVRKTLEKRRLIFENRKYQEDLEKAHFRIQLMHQLSLKMNSVYLSTVELDEILQAILVGITANEGLRFNRAFLAMFDDDNQFLRGRLAIGTTCREHAAEIWADLEKKDLNFMEIVHNVKDRCENSDYEVNNIIKAINIPSSDESNILIKSAMARRSIKVSKENGGIPVMLERRNVTMGGPQANLPPFGERRNLSGEQQHLSIPAELINILGEDAFVVVPLYSPGRAFGVIIADNFVTRRPITDSHVNALELFASQASLAIEHSHLYIDMQKKIKELEELNHELDKNKDMLVTAERYSALGQMAAQLVHVIRNPITSIGGVARILSKKVHNEEWEKYLSVMIKETSRLESTLEDLFDFVTHMDFVFEDVAIYELLRKTLMLVQADLERHKIEVKLQFPEPGPVFSMDQKQIRQMFLHLIKNAIEAMPNGGTLSVAVTCNENMVSTHIQDTGIGINESHLDKAKDSFFTTKTYGTGMGLTMVDRIVKAHGGNFELRKRDVGMEVIVNLPLQQ